MAQRAGGPRLDFRAAVRIPLAGRGTSPRSGVVAHQPHQRQCLVSCPINTSLAAPRLFAPGGVAPPRHSARYASSARLARHENSLADRARYLWDRTPRNNRTGTPPLVVVLT